jgi:hypothetical protein
MRGLVVALGVLVERSRGHLVGGVVRVVVLLAVFVGRLGFATLAELVGLVGGDEVAVVVPVRVLPLLLHQFVTPQLLSYSLVAYHPSEMGLYLLQIVRVCLACGELERLNFICGLSHDVLVLVVLP